MNPYDGSPIDLQPGPSTNFSGMTYMLGTPIREWLDVKMLADEEDISIRELVHRYRLFRHGERHHRGAAEQLAMRPLPVEMRLERSIEALRARESLLEERVASLERRFARLGSGWQRAVA